MSTQLGQIAKRAKLDRKVRFTSLAHLLTPEFLKETWGKMNRRASGGVDGVSAKQFESELGTHIEAICAQLKAGTYRAPPVRRVEIPKGPGKVGTRPLGIPTVSDRVAQAVVKGYLEPELERHFHPDSYGYRPGKSALEALGVARQRCWKYDWALDLDIRAFFDSISHELLLRAVRKHTDCAWVLLYIERWLKAPVQLEDGTLEPREKGTPQGSVVSPLLANAFLHYTFDRWMAKHHPDVPFERFADDILCHCGSEQQAQELKEALEKRFADCGLELHPSKTRIVYCKDDDRRGHYPNEKFDFLGFTFRARRSKNRWGKFFVNFSPGVSNVATKAIRRRMRSWQFRCRIDKWIDDLARMFNPVIQGWMNYYGRYYKSALYPTLRYFDRCLVRWAMAKYKRLRRHRRRAEHWVHEVASRDPKLFAHWKMLHRATAGR